MPGPRPAPYPDGSLYVGGTFWKMGTANRGGGARVDPATGALRSWNPATNWGIHTMTPAPDRSGMFIGGPFSTVSGQAQEYLAKASLAGGALQPWRARQDCVDMSSAPERCVAFDLATDRDSLFVAAGGPGGRVTSFSASTGAEQWRDQTDGAVQTIAVAEDTIVAGGHFTESFEASPVVGWSASTRTPARFSRQPSALMIASSEVWCLLVDGNVLGVGGVFTRVNGAAIGKYVTFSLTRVRPAVPVTVAAWRAGYGNVLRVDAAPN